MSLDVTQAGDVHVAVVDPATTSDRNGTSSSTSGADGISGKTLHIPPPLMSDAYALPETEFKAGVVGGKANNLARLRGTLPEWIQVPASVAVPFGTFERVLEAEANKAVAAKLSSLLSELQSLSSAEAVAAGVPPQLGAIRELVSNRLTAPTQLVKVMGLPTSHDKQRRCIICCWL